LWKIQEYVTYPSPIGVLMFGHLKVSEFFFLHMLGALIGFGGHLLHYLITEWILVEVGKRKDHVTFWILFVNTIVFVFAFTIPPPFDAFCQYLGLIILMFVVYHSRRDVIE
jgi:signal transduction histidine kinase